MVPVVRSFLSTQLRHLTGMHPLAKGVVSYAIIWPTASIIQQTIEGKNLRTYDYTRALRFAIFGSLYVAPSLYCWVRLTSAMWPQTNLRIGMIKAAVEQISYGPFACVSFFMGMNLLEGKTLDEGVIETQNKFLPTYKVGMCVWPFLQTINFAMVPERNRVVYTALCSLVWTSFLAYMKKKDMDELLLAETKEKQQINQQELHSETEKEDQHIAESLKNKFLQKSFQLNN